MELDKYLGKTQLKEPFKFRIDSIVMNNQDHHGKINKAYTYSYLKFANYQYDQLDGDDCVIKGFNNPETEIPTFYVAYRGGLKDGIKNGYGKEYFRNGEQRYQGHFQDGWYNDSDIEVFTEDGLLEFCGNLKLGNPDGYCKRQNAMIRTEANHGYFYDNKGLNDYFNDINGHHWVYDGNFKDGYPDGENFSLKKQSTNSEYEVEQYSHYTGGFKDGLYDGYGILWNYPFRNRVNQQNRNFDECFQYKGYFLKGLKHGDNCELRQNNGNVYYKGSFRNDKFNGRGKRYSLTYLPSLAFSRMRDINQDYLKYAGVCCYWVDNEPVFKGRENVFYDNDQIDLIHEDYSQILESAEPKLGKKSWGEFYYYSGGLIAEGFCNENVKLEEKNVVIYCDLISDQALIQYKGGVIDNNYQGTGVIFDRENLPIMTANFQNGKMSCERSVISKYNQTEIVSFVMFPMTTWVYVGPIYNGLKGGKHGDSENPLALDYQAKLKFRGTMKSRFSHRLNFAIVYWPNGQMKSVRHYQNGKEQKISFSKIGKKELL